MSSRISPPRKPRRRKIGSSRNLAHETLEKRELLSADLGSFRCAPAMMESVDSASNAIIDPLDTSAPPLDLTSAAEPLAVLGVAEGQQVDTPLDTYIKKADPSYAYSLADTIVLPGITTYIIDMTSQTWRTAAEVDKPVWQHWVQIIVPDTAVSDTAVLAITGGTNLGSAPTQPDAAAAAFALQTNQVTVSLPNIPSQPLVFTDDPGNPRVEDAVIAYSFDKYLKGGDDEWPVLLPMVKSAVRAMDTVQDFLDDQIPLDIEDFVLTGGSKRGWTTWLTAAVDDRVSAIAPAVIDFLNIEPSLENHRENYEGVTQGIIGGYARAIRDYTGFGIFDQNDTPRGQELLSIVDPYQYLDRITIPKYLVNGTADQFFTPDSSLFYYQDLIGPKYLRYIPNTDHFLDQSAGGGIASFFTAIEEGTPLPEFDWTFEGEDQNTIRVQASGSPLDVRLWQSTNLDSLDFRIETGAPAYTSSQLLNRGNGEYVATVAVPPTGGTAYFVELTYLVDGLPQKFTTQAAIVRSADIQVPTGPQLAAIRPDAGELLLPGDTLNVAPREFNLLFEGGADLDESTITTDSVKLVRSGGDGIFGDDNEVEVALGYVGLLEPGSTDPTDLQQIVLRPASSASQNSTDPAFAFPDDYYQIQITGFGPDALTNRAGEGFNDYGDLSTEFRLDRGAQVVAVVPQPISHGPLAQASDEIVVYFDDQLLDADQATNPDYYQLINTANTLTASDDTAMLPQSVNYDSAGNFVVLTFASDLPEGTYRLDIGQDRPFSPSVPIDLDSVDDDDSTITTAMDIGSLGNSTVTISAQIESQSIALPPWPGSEDEPGHRQIQREQHINAFGTVPTVPQEITTRQYHFPDTLGTDPSGNPYLNLISDDEKQIVREILEIYAQVTGFEFIESNSGGSFVGKGDLRALSPDIGPDSGVGGLGGPAGVVLNGSIWNQSNRFFGDGFTGTMFHELGHALGLDHAYDQPANLGAGVPNDILPGDHDIVHLQRIVPPNSTDIDMYRFDLTEPGRLQVQTIAERQSSPSLLNSALQLYQQLGDDIKLVAQNDQYFGSDSYIDLTLPAGVYFVGVTSTGNTHYDPRVADSGYGGTTDGNYELQIEFEPSNSDGTLTDADGTPIDGDGDGKPGGVHSFWFQASEPAATIYVDKSNDTTAGSADGVGTLADPLDNIHSALQLAGTRIVVPTDGLTTIQDGESFQIDDGVNTAVFEFGTGGTNPIDLSAATGAADIADIIASAIDGSGLSPSVEVVVNDRVVQINGIERLDLADSPTLMQTPNLVRIVGNGGTDGNLDTLQNNLPYLIGLDSDGDALEDGGTFSVPQAVTVMIEAGALLKLRKANLDVGTSAVDIGRQHGALQILGTPEHGVLLRSYHDDSAGGDSDGFGEDLDSGDFGGIVFRDDSDLESAGVFLNYVNHADISHGGGKVSVGALESVFSPVHIIDARPTLSFSRIGSSDFAAVSASPDSFQETDGRIGPDVLGNYLDDNTIDGLFIRVTTPVGSTLNKLTVSGRLDDTDIPHVLTENLIIAGAAGGPSLLTGSLVARAAGRLMVDPGIVLKLSDARIEAERGAGTLIAEGTADRPVIFTSLDDNRYGGSGSFDSNSSPNSVPNRGDWGGLYFGHATFGSLDHAIVAYAGGSTPIEGGAANFNAIEVHQADLRITNSVLQHNASGNASGNRNGRGANLPATIYVRGSQPIVVDNVIADNDGPVININASALRHETLPDPGRSTGAANPFVQFADNHGPLVRLNRLENNVINGMVIRGGELTTESVWDDTDIVHVLLNEIIIDNHHTRSGLTLQSSNSQSLVVKLFGSDAGLTATGTPVEITDRIGGTIHILGTVGHPVVLTHISDDSIGAGFTPSGEVMFNTDNSSSISTGTPGEWRGLRFDEFSNDQNVAVVRELENPLTNGMDINSTPFVAQTLGHLAPDKTSGDENRRLGFEVNGHISPNDTGDIDVYNFTATAGTGIWIDIDDTDTTLDAIIEVVNENGIVLARSMRSGDLNADGTLNVLTLEQSTFLGGDHYTQNFRDPGMHYVLPGPAGTEVSYFIRVRSNPATAGDVTQLQGESSGAYSLQIRLDQVQAFPGSTVQFADIRFAQIGIDVRGLPAHSPLVSDAGELAANNDTFASAQQLVNLMETDLAALGIAGELSAPAGDGLTPDIDWYQFDLLQTGVQVIEGVNDSPGTIAVVFDLDYSDNAVRGDTTIAVFDQTQTLIYVGRESNITDDQPIDLSGNVDDLGRGSLGTRDPYIGPIHLTPGSSYSVAVMSDQHLPSALTGVFQANPTNPANALVRLEPVNSVTRIVEDHIGQQGYVTGPSMAPVPVLPSTQDGLFDVTNGVIGSGTGVDASVTPLTLQDVVLFVATDLSVDTGDGLYTVDPFRSDLYQTQLTDSLVAGGEDVQDIVIRSDGRMFGYQQLLSNQSSGALVELDPSNNGAILSSQGDDIPSSAAAPNVVGALTFQRTGTGGSPNSPTPSYDIYYAVDQPDVGAHPPNSKLYRATEDGSAANQPPAPGTPPYGLLGDIQPAGVTFASMTLTVFQGVEPGDIVEIELTSKVPGSYGNLINLNIARPDDTIAEVTEVVGTRIDINIGGTGGPPFTAAPSAQAIVDAINNNADASRLVTASLVGQDPPNPTALILSADRNLTGGSDDSVAPPILGRVTGLSYSNFLSTGNLYGVTSVGEFLEINPDNGVVLNRVDLSATTGGFSGLALGPQNVESGAYQNVMFATSSTGDVYALNTSGELQPIFDGGADSIQVLVGGSPVGLAFSPLDFNLWHPTNKRGAIGELGHGISTAPDNTREGVVPDLEVSQPSVAGQTSYHFGFEQWVPDTNSPPDALTDEEVVSYIQYNGVNAQFGILSDSVHSDLSSNPNLVNTYNFPGGGYGSLTTNSFSLAGSNSEDRPTLYFNYYLESENHGGADSDSNADDPFRDSARVFVSSDGGTTWELVATNNSQLSPFPDPALPEPIVAELPGFLSHRSDAGLNSENPRAVEHQIVQELFDNTGSWRQARVDLSTFANESDLMLRFDFSTAGAMGDPSLESTDEQFGELTSLERSIRSSNNAFEGFYIDDIIVGFAERGEMVTGATPDATITDLQAIGTPTANPDPEPFPSILRGPYHLEIRRTGEYVLAGDETNSVGQTYGTNERHTLSANTTGLAADRNRERVQGMFILDSNFITDSSTVGISVQPGSDQGGGVKHPAATIPFPLLNADRLAPGVVIQNNVITGSSGIQFAGDASDEGNPAVSFGRIVNNTFVGRGGGDIGIEISGQASPTLLNNLLNNFGTAISDQGVGTIVRSNFFQGNTSIGTTGTDAISAAASAPLFLDPANRNYILDANSLAVDSSQNVEQDRLDYFNFKHEIGIPASPIIAPDRDIYGQLRVDSNAGPGGGGADIFKDRGATDRSDNDSPYAVLLNPVDNDSTGQDQNPATTVVYPTDPLLENFTLLLGDGSGPQSPFQGTGISGLTVDDPNDPGVSAASIMITQNETLLTQDTDYTVAYNELTGVLLLTPLSTLWNPRSIYTIALDNTRIKDKSGNRLRGNQTDGSTQFTIVMPDVQFDFGDAPASFGTLLVDGGPQHTFADPSRPRLGTLIDSEREGQPINGDDADGADDEDGLLIGTMIDGANSFVVFTTPGADPDNVQPDEVAGFLNPNNRAGEDIYVHVVGSGFLDGWIDFDQNGVFDEAERVFDSTPVSGDAVDGSFVSLKVVTPFFAPTGPTWMRLRISDSGGLSPTGLSFGGEVEDYPVEVYRFTTTNPNEPPTFDITAPLVGGVHTLDLLEGDEAEPVIFDGFAENIFPGLPTSLDETTTQFTSFSVLQTGGATGLMTSPPSLSTDGRLTIFPVADAVGTFEYDITLTDTHPFDRKSTTKSFTLNLRPVNDAPSLNSTVVPSTDTDPTDPELSYSVAADGTITYTLREDNTQTGGLTEPFFIPMFADSGSTYNRIGLMDVLDVGPTNESDGTVGGSQNLSLIDPVDASAQQIIGVTIQQLSDNEIIDTAPRISGSNVVWERGANSFPFHREIMFYDGNTTTQVTTNEFTDRDPQISGNNVTWWGSPGSSPSDPEIYFWNGGEITQITDDAVRDEAPQISGSTVAWVRGEETDLEIYKWDGGPLVNVSNSPGVGDSTPQVDGNSVVFASGSAPIFSIQRNDGDGNSFVSVGVVNRETPQIDGDRVVWRQIESSSVSDIYLFDGTARIPITNDFAHNFTPDISGKYVVWTNLQLGNSEIYLYDADSQETTQITQNSSKDINPQIDGNLVVWQGSDGNDDEIFAWDGTRITQITDNDYDDQVPQISGNQIVWQASSKGAGNGIEIFHAELDIGYAATEMGGRLSPVYDGGDLIGWNYTPPADFNSDSGVDSFTYTVSDDGVSYDLDTGTLSDDPQQRENRVVFSLAPVNDAPVFDLSTDRIVISEDDPLVAIDDFATNIAGGPIGTANDENDPPSPQTLEFSITPLDFDAAEMPSFFSSLPTVNSQTGRLTFQTAANVFGSYQFEVRLRDDGANDFDRGDINESGPQLLTINVLAQNDQPALDSSAAPVDRTLDEDSTVEIELADLIAAFSAGPTERFADESANVIPGGNQTLSILGALPTTTSAGGTLEQLTTGGPPRLLYTPPTNFNGTDTFVYNVTDDGVSVGIDEIPFGDPRTAANTVTLNVNSVNDPPVFDIDAPVVGGIPTLNLIEPDTGDPISISGFATNIGPGPITAVDESSSQQVSFSISEISVPTGMMTQLPSLTPSGQLTLFPIADAVGTAIYTATLTDDHPTDPQSITKTFIIRLQPVNDQPALNPAVVPTTTVSNPTNDEDAYSVADDGTITYTLREDNTQSAGVSEPFFIPLTASGSAGFNRIGLLDVFTVGPANEADGSPGGSQTLSLADPTVGATTDQGGTLTPVAGGWHYIPPTDFNFTIGGVDSFTYQVSDDGTSYDFDSGNLIADPLARTNRVQFILAAVNDAPEFDTSTDRIVIEEDAGLISIAGFASNIGGGPIGTATDENDLPSLQSLAFSITPLDFDPSDMPAFFSTLPVISPQTGRLTFQTAANVYGSYQFEVRLNDGGDSDPDRGDINQSAPQLLTINVLAQNDVPAIDPNIGAVERTLDEDGSVEISIADLLGSFAPGPLPLFADEAANVTPGGNQTLAISGPLPSTTTAGGSLELLTDGGEPRVLYTPSANFNGTDSFVFTVIDDGVTVGLDESPFADPRSASSTVTLNVRAINDAPEFDLVTSIESDEDAGLVTIENWATNVQAGPSTATDEISGSAPQQLNFQFSQVGGDPDLIVPGSLSASIDPVTQIATLFFESSPNANGMATIEVVLQDNGPSDAGNGDRNASDPQTFVINVAPVNDAPSFEFLSTDPIVIDEDSGPQTIVLIDSVSPGPADENLQTVTFEVQPLASEFSSLFASLPTIDANGVLRFTIAPNQSTENEIGPIPLQVIARDSGGATSDPSGFQITVRELEDPPVAIDDTFNTDEDTVLILDVSDLLANDSDPDLLTNPNEIVLVQLAAQTQTPTGAWLLFDAQTGQISYDPTGVPAIQQMTAGDSTSDSFTYTLIDAAGNVSDPATVSLNIAGVNDAPTANPDNPFVEPEGSTVIDVLDNDSDFDSSIDPTTVQIFDAPDFGTVVVTTAGSIIYTPFVDMPTTHSFSYTVADDLGRRSEPATITITANASPVAGDDFGGTFMGESVVIDVTANDSDADGLVLTSVVIVEGPLNGQAIPQSDGQILYMPDVDFAGGDSFTYQISDSVGRISNVAEVTTSVVASRLQNPAMYADVNADGNVTALDALLIINHLGAMGGNSIPVLDTDRGPNFYDVSGNQEITAADALRVINELANPSSQAAGEQPSLQPSARSAIQVSLASDESSGSVFEDWSETDLTAPTKIVSTSTTSAVSRELIDAIVEDDEDQRRDDSRSAIDAVMAELS